MPPFHYGTLSSDLIPDVMHRNLDRKMIQCDKPNPRYTFFRLHFIYKWIPFCPLYLSIFDCQ